MWIKALAIAIVLDFALLFWLRKHRVRFFQKPSFPSFRFPDLPRGFFILLGELSLVLLWAGWVGRYLLDFNENLWPPGIDFPLSVRENIFWENLRHCGSCALWNGGLNGGYPSLIDLLGAPLHPLVAIPTLLFGVINGGKVAVVLGLALAGVAQLWLGYILELRWAARLWAALMAVVAGTIVGRMEIGLVTLVLSTASGALVIAAILSFYKNRSWETAIVLGWTIALAVFSGQGYIQLALIFCIAPSLLLLFIGADGLKRPDWIKLTVALFLGFLVSGIQLVPLVHHGMSLEKEIDTGLTHAQPLEYQPIHLIVREESYFSEQTLSKSALPFVFLNYLGWGPILFAIAGWTLAPRQKIRWLLFFVASIGMLYLAGSMVLLRFLFKDLAPEFLFGLRHAPVMIGLAGPLILALAGWGADLVFQVESGERFSQGIKNGLSEIRPLRILLILMGLWSISSAYFFNLRWLGVAPLPPITDEMLPRISTSSAEWVQMPDHHYWTLLALERNLKLTKMFSPWHFRKRPIPEPYLQVTEGPTDLSGNLLGEWEGLFLLEYPENHYATVIAHDGTARPCAAKARGGQIDVSCSEVAAGELIVQETALPGWQAFVDGKRIQLSPGDWLSVSLPAGNHTVQFRYRPWDVFCGGALSLLGVSLTFFLLSKTTRRPKTERGQ